MCKRKTTPPSGLVSVLLDLPRDRYPRPTPEGDHFAWSPRVGDGIVSGRKVSRHIFLEDGGGEKKESQGPSAVWSLRVGWVVVASVTKSGRNLINPCQRPVCRGHRGPKPRFSGFEATLRITSGERRGGGCILHSLRSGGEAPRMPESPGHIFPLVLARFLVAVGVRSGGTYPLGVPNRSTQVSAKPTPVKIQTVALLPDIFWFIKIVERYGAQAQTFQKPPPDPPAPDGFRAEGRLGWGERVK